MKKYLLLVLLGLSSIGFACDQCMCKYLLDIVISNTTSADCVLISQSIDNGLIYTKSLPLKIASGFQSDPYTFELGRNGETDVTLSFQCGDDKFATFKSQRMVESGFWSNPEKIMGTVIAASNLDATYVGKPSHCSTPLAPATIYWTLK